jgi:hypothetical protein
MTRTEAKAALEIVKLMYHTGGPYNDTIAWMLHLGWGVIMGSGGQGWRVIQY